MESSKRQKNMTDVFCCLIFFLLWLTYGYACFVALSRGDINNMIRTYDEDKSPCGVGDRKKFPYLFIKDITKPLEGNICVKSCPKSDKESLLCYATSHTNCNDLKSYSSYEFMNRICLPTFKGEADKILDKINIGKIKIIIGQAKKYWKVILLSVLLAFIIGYFYNWFLEHYVGMLTICMILGVLFTLGMIGYFFYSSGVEKLNKENQSKQNLLKGKNLYYTGIGIWVFSVFVLIYFFNIFDRVKSAIKVISFTADFISDVPRIVFVPIFLTIINIIFVVQWVYIFSLLSSIGEVNESSDFIIGFLIYSLEIRILIYISIIFLFWGLFFISHLSVFVINYSAYEWFISINQDDMTSPIFSAFIVGLVYHTGTIAFGSLILSLFWVFQIISSTIHRLVLGEVNQKKLNFFQKIFAKLCYYYIGCFECFFKFLNKNAYSECFINSEGFCKSASNSLEIESDQMVRFTILNVLIEIFNLLTSVFISSVITVISFFIIKFLFKDVDNYRNVTGSLFLIFLIGLYVSSSFTQVYDNAANAIMYFYLKKLKAKPNTNEFLNEIFQIENNNKLLN